MYLKFVGIPSWPKKTITNKIGFCNYIENDETDHDKWEIDSDGKVDPFFNAIVDVTSFDNVRENHVSMRGEGRIEVGYQAGEFVLISNHKIYAMKKDNFMLRFSESYKIKEV